MKKKDLKKSINDEEDLTSIREKTFIQRLGPVVKIIGVVVALIAAGMVYLFVKELCFDSELHWKMLLGIPIIVAGIALFSFGNWLSTPKGLRGKYRIFYD